MDIRTGITKCFLPFLRAYPPGKYMDPGDVSDA